MRDAFVWSLGAVIVLTLCAVQAQAHRLHAFVTVEDGVIRGQAYFQGGTPAVGAQIKLFGLDDALAGEASTDAEGRFALGPVAPGQYRLVVDAGLGHTVERHIAASEGGSGQAPISQSGEPAPERASTLSGHEICCDLIPDSSEEPSLALKGSHAGSGDLQLSELAGEIRRLRNEVVSLQALLEKQASRARIQDVVGGVGYIVGVMALLYLVRSSFGRGRQPHPFRSQNFSSATGSKEQIDFNG